MMSPKSCGYGKFSPGNLAGDSLEYQLWATRDDKGLVPQPLFTDQEQLQETQCTANGTDLVLKPVFSDLQWLRETHPLTTTVQSDMPKYDIESLIENLLDDYYFSSFSGLGSVYLHDEERSISSNDIDIDDWVRSLDLFYRPQSMEDLAVLVPGDVQQTDSRGIDLAINSMDSSVVSTDDTNFDWELHDRLMEYRITYRPSSCASPDLVSPKARRMSLSGCCESI